MAGMMVEGALARGQRVGVLGVELEEGAAVLHEDAGSRGHEGGAELEVDALNERAGLPIPIHGAEVDRVATHTRLGGVRGRARRMSIFSARCRA